MDYLKSNDEENGKKWFHDSVSVTSESHLR